MDLARDVRHISRIDITFFLSHPDPEPCVAADAFAFGNAVDHLRRELRLAGVH